MELSAKIHLLLFSPSIRCNLVADFHLFVADRRLHALFLYPTGVSATGREHTAASNGTSPIYRQNSPILPLDCFSLLTSPFSHQTDHISSSFLLNFDTLERPHLLNRRNWLLSADSPLPLFNTFNLFRFPHPACLRYLTHLYLSLHSSLLPYLFSASSGPILDFIHSNRFAPFAPGYFFHVLHAASCKNFFVEMCQKAWGILVQFCHGSGG